jgi:hypothetical protein
VTSLTRAECRPKYLYEKVYCARGEMENRIKECQLDLYADRTSTAAAPAWCDAAVLSTSPHAHAAHRPDTRCRNA